MYTRSSLIGLLFLLSCVVSLEAVKPICVYLTLKGDPLTSMTVQWITDFEQTQDEVEFSEADQAIWEIAKGTHLKMPMNFPYFIHRVELTKLTPDTIYRFKIGAEGKTYQFKTMPANLDKPINFVAGGDVYHDGIEYLIETNRQAALLNPYFALIGGDIAYSNTTRHMRWIEWLSAWERTMVTQDGYLIPIVPALGNHDVDGRFNQNPLDAPFFYALFDVPGYRVLDFGKYLSVWVMDSGHTHPIDGAQTNWLSKALHDRDTIPHKFALYHVPAYPCVRPYHYQYSRLVRVNWGTLFEQFGLNAAFENHDHAYKRSHPLKNRQIVPSGVLYLGDGSWGVKKPRAPRSPKKTWYLAATAQKRHFIHVTVSKDQRRYQAIDHQGRIFDSVSQPVVQLQAFNS